MSLDSQHSESQHLDDLGRGDKGMFDRLFDRHWLMLYRVAKKIVEDESVSKDIVQEAFISLWEKAQHAHILNVEAYLCQTVKYRCFMHLRSGRISRKHLARLQAIAFSNTIEEEYNLHELEDVLMKSIATLPDKCRQVFYLSRYEYWPHQKIAKQLKISPKTVENHLTKALRILRISIEKLAALFLFTNF